MSEKHIELAEGDTLRVTVASTPPPTPPLPTELTVLLTIDGVKFYVNADKSYCCFTSDLDICNDGSGPSHGDPSYQPQTAYYNGGKFLNADSDKYIVVPPQIRQMLPGVVMGCKGKLTNKITNVTSPAVIGDIGPDYTSGEAAYCLAKLINPSVSHNSGDKARNYFYELWPDVPAVVDGKTYKLEPA